MAENYSILVIAAHPDDEVLGCGGTIARHAGKGDSVVVAFLADGVSSRGGNRDMIERRRNAAVKSMNVLGAKAPVFFDFPDNRMDTVPLLDVVKKVEELAAAHSPHMVYTHHGNDLNVDHRIAHQAVMTAFRPLPQSRVRAIYSFETPSSTEWSSPDIGAAFTPRHFVDIGDFLETKIDALKCYADEVPTAPHPRSVEAVQSLAIWRGGNAGLKAAEAFDVLRQIENG